MEGISAFSTCFSGLVMPVVYLINGELSIIIYIHFEDFCPIEYVDFGTFVVCTPQYAQFSNFFQEKKIGSYPQFRALHCGG